LPLLLKFSPPFELPPIHLICCGTGLGQETLRFSFHSTFLAGLSAGTGANQLPWLNNTITFPIAPAKVIRHKPINGILTARKHQTWPLPGFTFYPIRPFPATAPA
jgi:hypothetical protein